MFRRSDEDQRDSQEAPTRVDSVLGEGLAWKGTLTGQGGLRIDGAFDGDIQVHGLVVVGRQGRVTCEHIIASTVVIAGSVKGDIQAQRVEIQATGRIWGDVVTASFSTEEGAFMRGKITMEEELEMEVDGGKAPDEEAADGSAD